MKNRNLHMMAVRLLHYLIDRLDYYVSNSNDTDIPILFIIICGRCYGLDVINAVWRLWWQVIGSLEVSPGGEALHSWCCITLIRKSKDYVYGIWVYKALDIWKGYYRVKKSLVSYVKPWTEARNNKYMKYHSKLTYQLSCWNVSRKVDYHAGGKWYIHGPKRRKENQLLSLKHSCWLSLV